MIQRWTATARRYGRIIFRDRRAIFFRSIPYFLVLFSLASVIYLYRSETAKQQQKKSQLELLASASSFLSQGIHGALRDVNYLAHDFSVTLYEGPEDAALQALRKRFIATARLNPRYIQIRYIDASGQERLRLNQEDRSLSFTPKGQLQNKAHRYYVQDSANLEINEVYISRWDLNMEHTRIQQPFLPVVRTAAPVFSGNGHRRGILIINLDARPIVGGLKSFAREMNTDFFLVGHDGEWVAGETPEDDWSRDLKRTEPFRDRYPSLWEEIQTRKSGDYIGRDGFWTFSEFSFRLLGHTADWKVHSPSWWLITRSQYDTALGLHRQSLLESLALFLCSSFLLILYLARKSVLKQERAELLENLEHTRTRLVRAERLSTLSHMVAGLSHELNTPIGAAQLMTGTLLQRTEENPRETETYQEGLEVIQECLIRINQLVSSFRKMTVDRRSMTPVWFDLQEVLRDVGRGLQNEFKEEKHEILVECPGIRMFGIPGPLGQVIQYLALNSLEHGFKHPGGIVTIRARIARKMCLITVSDNGAGIDPDKLTRIFDPFFTTARSAGHAGLGLSIVQELVKGVLQGSITVRRSRDSGTTFRLAFPQEIRPVKNTPQ